MIRFGKRIKQPNPIIVIFYIQVIHQKYRISYDEIINDLCPVSLYPFQTLCLSAWGLYLLLICEFNLRPMIV